MHQVPVELPERAPRTDAAARTTGAAVIRGSAWSALGALLPQAYTLVLSIAAAQFLGPAGMGRQSFIAFVSLSAVTLFSAGMSVGLMRAVAEALGRGEPEQARGLSRWAARLQLLAGLAGGAIVAAPALTGARDGLSWALAGAGTTAMVLQSAPNAVLIGARRWREASAIGLVTGAVGVPATVLALHLGGGIPGIFAVQTVVAAANLLWTGAVSAGVLRAEAPVAAPPDAAARRTTLRYAGITTVGAVLTLVVWRRSEFFFLARASTDTQIALYSIAFAAFTVVATLPERLGAVMSSAFATLHGAREQERMRAGYGRALRLLILLALPVTALAAALGGPAIRVAYGPEYAGATAPLLVLLTAVPLIPLWDVTTSLLTGLGNARTPLAVSAAAAVANVALALVLVPRLDAVGAALTNVGGQVVASALLYGLVHRRVAGPGVAWRRGGLARAVLVSAGAGVAAWWAADALGGVSGLAAGVLAGAAVLVTLGRALRPVPADDAAWLSAQLRGTGGAPVARLLALAAAR